MAWSLRNQIMFTFSSLMLITLLTVSVFDTWLSVIRSDRQLRNRMHSMIEALKSSDYPLTPAVLEQMQSYSNAEFVVTDTTGSIFSSSLVIPPAAWQSLSPLLPEQQNSVVEVQGISYMHSSTRTARPDTPHVHIFFPLSTWYQERREAVWQHFLVGIMTLALACAVAIRLANKLAAPIHQLNEQIQRIAQGNFQHVPPPERPTELHELATAVNTMVNELTHLSQTIQRTERLALIAQLSAGLAHQLRNAIVGASLAIEVHELRCTADSESLAVAKRQLKLTEDQIRRLLTDREKTHAPKELVDLTQTLQGALEMLRPTFEHRKIILQKQVEPHSCLLLGNAEQLQQLITEILLNALDAAGVTGTVNCQLEQHNGVAQLRISDSGPGVSPALRERLFEPFVTGKTEGIGLGLTTARQIATYHGGTLLLLPNTPNTFEVTLPLASENEGKKP